MEFLRNFLAELANSGLLPDFFAYGFVINSIIAAILIGPMLGGIGTMVVIKKMAFFSEAIGHAAIAGISIGILLGESYNSPYIMLFSYCIIFGLIINYTRNRTKMGTDTLIGIFLSISIALGAILLIYISGKVNSHMLETVLFGSILTVSDFDLKVLLFTNIILIILIMLWYNKMLLSSFNRNIAIAKNVNVVFLEYVFILIITIITVASVKIIGSALVEALLIIPAASAKNLSKSIRGFILLSIIFSTISCILGIIVPLSLSLSLPSGPAIILVASTIFFVTVVIKNITQKYREGGM
ncbi:metal ABC transporter permease [Streptobacillus moniliformis]|uniref:ABC-3 protein n=1 Tax=Streptobacillus moniliformis (strain ATCC 14647 / DSM 12112 / NCTC 10651 / 9901) TaxID=519441 RepID=D1AWW5_STRM9|nr:metal ABC transporter permease [Streptobacillus moniliformis]ACZ00791.1 ABC-3 protein [Streptobacillus moniliformis DSM 12112]AVL43717.1 metal ABC transporter permease [Streptobacillus moniliformis]QXW65545.1 metal ABC transporter permease [Streptobacillus moniliformis]SQA14074.1 High-affinity zinc uptake system membrane protein znuB [Streptobacillus moniliformis]